MNDDQNYHHYYQINPIILEDARRIFLVKKILQIIRLDYLNQQKIIDIGCGSGLLVNFLAQSNNQITGLDISLNNIEQARARLRKKDLRAELLQGDVLKLPLVDNNFDLVICLETLEHVVDPDRAVNELKRITKPGGKIILSVPDNEKIKQELCVYCHKLTPRNGHLHSFDPEKITKLISRAGLRVNRIKSISSKISFMPWLEIFYFWPLSLLINMIDQKISTWLKLFPPLIIVEITKPL